MTRVFVKVSYEVFNLTGFFTAFHKFVGPFRIEQTEQESIDKMFAIWFYADLDIKEGESRQVGVDCTRHSDDNFEFKIQTI